VSSVGCSASSSTFSAARFYAQDIDYRRMTLDRPGEAELTGSVSGGRIEIAAGSAGNAVPGDTLVARRFRAVEKYDSSWRLDREK
jgi:hypothetical protein